MTLGSGSTGWIRTGPVDVNAQDDRRTRQGEPVTAARRSVTVATVDHVATVVLDNPPLNVLDLCFFRDFEAICDELAARDDVHAVVVTGSGERAFSAGADAGEHDGEPVSIEDRGRRLELECRAFDKLAALPQPTVAAIRGCALGAGLELALSCDFRIAGRSAELGLPEVELGVLPASVGLTRLPLIAGDSGAKRLAMLGERIAADTAEELGLVDEVVDDESVARRSTELASRLAKRPPATVRAIKRILGAQRELSHEEALRLIVETALSRSLVDRAAPMRRNGGPTRGECEP
jgi:enoyl-CoA hydratase